MRTIASWLVRKFEEKVLGVYRPGSKKYTEFQHEMFLAQCEGTEREWQEYLAICEDIAWREKGRQEVLAGFELV
jgi:hypothetical protein